MSAPKLITEPRVFLLASPQIHAPEVARYLDSIAAADWTSTADCAGDALVEIAGRVCYQSFAKPRPGGNQAYLDHIRESGHGSVCEHANYTLLLTGVSRNLSHELIRHRAGFGYSELSQRYVDCADVAFVVPPAMIGWWRDWVIVETKRSLTPKTLYKDPAFKGWDNFNEWELNRRANLHEYESLASDLLQQITTQYHGATDPGTLTQEQRTTLRKRAREAARSVLPGCTETQVVVTGNARAWRHFLEMRGSRHADAEIHRLALAVLPVLQGVAANLFSDYRVENNEIVTETRKI